MRRLGVDLRPQIGRRVIWGIEGTGDGWTVGAEVEADLPDARDSTGFPSTGRDLIPAVRIGVAVRRHF